MRRRKVRQIFNRSVQKRERDKVITLLCFLRNERRKKKNTRGKTNDCITRGLMNYTNTNLPFYSTHIATNNCLKISANCFKT